MILVKGDHSPSVKGGSGLQSHPIDPDFPPQLLQCLNFGLPYLLFWQTPCITNFLRSPWVHDQTAAISYSYRFVRHLDSVSVEF